MCKKQVTTIHQNTTSFRQSSVSTQKKKEDKHSKTPEDALKKANPKSDRLASVQPVTSAQFKEILNQRRALLLNNK